MCVYVYINEIGEKVCLLVEMRLCCAGETEYFFLN